MLGENDGENGIDLSGDLVPARPLRLLVAEDIDINRLLGEALLRKLGHVPVMVVDGEKAVEEASKRLLRRHFDGICTCRASTGSKQSRRSGRQNMLPADLRCRS